MDQVLFVKEVSQILKEDDYVIGDLTRKCKVGKVISISDKLLTIEVLYYNGDIDDVIVRKLTEFNTTIFKAKKIDLDKDTNYDYCVINY